MEVLRCGSSHLMTEMLKWRNPQHDDELLHAGGGRQIDDMADHVGRVIAVQLGLILALALAVIEVVVFSVLMLIMLPTICCPGDHARAVFRLMSSSAFTFIWSLSILGFHNFCGLNTYTHESYARSVINMQMNADFQYVDEIIRQLQPIHIQAALNAVPRQARNPVVADHDISNVDTTGTRFHRNPRSGKVHLTEDDIREAGQIMKGLMDESNEATKEALESYDSAAFNLALFQLVFHYTVGPGKEEQVPRFFRTDTSTDIHKIRRQNPVVSDSVKDQLKTYATNITRFKAGVDRDGTTKELYIKIKSAASRELSASELTTKVFPWVLQQM